jgi:predicted outer membrane repeat protein
MKYPQFASSQKYDKSHRRSGVNVRFVLATLIALLCTYEQTAARQVYVDADAKGNNDGSSWADAYNHLQDALAAVSSGDKILVAQGVYKPDRGKAAALGDRAATFQLINGVVIRGGYAGCGQPDPNARDIQAYKTILSGDLNDDDEPNFANNGDNSYHVVAGSGTDQTAVLVGLIIKGGMYNRSGRPTVISCTFADNLAWRGGGMRNYHSSPSLTNCKFSNNSARDAGGGMYNYSSSPVLTDCTFSENSALNGGGIYNCLDSNPALVNCTFSENSARYSGAMGNYLNSNPSLSGCNFSGNSAEYGGAIRNYRSNPMLANCTFTNNSATGDGGAVNNNSSHPTLATCVFAKNLAAGHGGAIRNYSSSPKLSCCTIVGNSAEQNGGGISNRKNSNPSLSNCILWLNSDANGTNESSQIYTFESEPAVNQCCIQGWTGTLAGSGNFGTDPKLADATANNYHLLPGSPCIDAGQPEYVAKADGTDVDWQPRIINGRVDIGADEYDNQRLVPSQYATIQAAIDAAFGGEVIVVSPGTYSGEGNRDIDFKGKKITVRSTHPEDPAVVAATIIDCENKGRGFHFHSGEDEHSVLKGVTIINGYATNGGGIHCNNSSPTFANCVLKDNRAKYGGGMHNRRSDPKLINCTFGSNAANENGGGIYSLRSNLTLTGCEFSGNLCKNFGGGMFIGGDNLTLARCSFSGNRAGGNGGGMYNRNGNLTLTNCILTGNSAGDNGGGTHNNSNMAVLNCTFSGNSAGRLGGGIYSEDYTCSHGLTLANCILWDNRGSGKVDEPGQIYGGAQVVTYSCIQDVDPNDATVYAGTGNIGDDPCFVRPGYWAAADNLNVSVGPADANAVWVDGDYHLLPNSPCIDAGNPRSQYSLEPELNGRRINMGAYGNTPDATSRRE